MSNKLYKEDTKKKKKKETEIGTFMGRIIYGCTLSLIAILLLIAFFVPSNINEPRAFTGFVIMIIVLSIFAAYGIGLTLLSKHSIKFKDWFEKDMMKLYNLTPPEDINNTERFVIYRPNFYKGGSQVGLGHGNLAARLLREETQCFAFLAGHESFAAAEGAIKIAEMANKVRKNPLRVILNGLGKDAAQIISRINGFTYVKTEFDYYTGELKVVDRIAYSDGPRAKVNCYGANDVREGVAINWSEDVDVSITGNSTNPTRFQHPVAGTYKKERILAGKPYFSVASGGGTGRTLHPDNMAAGPASYGMTDTLGRMHSDAQFAGSSSVPAHVEMMGFLGIGNNPMVGATVAIAVAIDLALNKK